MCVYMMAEIEKRKWNLAYVTLWQGEFDIRWQYRILNIIYIVQL